MPFSVCASLGTFLSLAAVVLTIFVSISQIRPNQTVPRHVRMALIDTTGFGQAVVTASGGNGGVPADFYGSGNGAGLRPYYSIGVWASCAAGTVDGTADYCSDPSFGNYLALPDIIVADVPQQYQNAASNVIPQSTFTASGYLRNFTRAAFYLIFIGAILAGISLFISIAAERFAWLLGAIAALLSGVSLAAAAIIWTIMIVKLRGAVNNATVGAGTPLGITVSYGVALWLLWAAAGAMLVATLPFLLACCFGRNKDRYDPQAYEGSHFGGGASVGRSGTHRSTRSQRNSQYAPSTRGSVRY